MNMMIDHVTISTQVFKHNQKFLQADPPIRLQYSNQIKLLSYTITKEMVKQIYSDEINVIGRKRGLHFFLILIN